jgi:hypothetical protein
VRDPGSEHCATAKSPLGGNLHPQVEIRMNPQTAMQAKGAVRELIVGHLSAPFLDDPDIGVTEATVSHPVRTTCQMMRDTTDQAAKVQPIAAPGSPCATDRWTISRGTVSRRCRWIAPWGLRSWGILTRCLPILAQSLNRNGARDRMRGLRQAADQKTRTFRPWLLWQSQPELARTRSAHGLAPCARKSSRHTV